MCVRVSLGVGTTRPHEGDEDTREACVSLARAQQQHALEHRATCREGVSSSCASLVVAQYPMYCARPTTKHHPRSLTQPRTPMQRAVHTRKENDRRFTIEISLSISLQPSLHYQPHLGTAPPLVVPTERAKEAACSERARERRKKRRSHPHTQRKRASLLGPTLSSGQGIPGPRHALIFVPRLDFCRFSLRRPSLLGWNSALLRAPRNVSNR